MKSKQISVIKTVWSCNNPVHEHLSENAGNNCIARSTNNKAATFKEVRARWIEIYLLVLRGKTFKEVAEIIDRTPQVPRNVFNRVARLSWDGKAYPVTEEEKEYALKNIRYLKQMKANPEFWEAHAEKLKKYWKL